MKSCALNGFTINGSVDCVYNSVCRTYENTIQNSTFGDGLRASLASISSQEDSIINNSGVGVRATNQSSVLLWGDTVSNNGEGVQVNVGSFVSLTASPDTNQSTTISNNGDDGVSAFSHGTVRIFFANITGNAGDGIRVHDGSVLRTERVAPTVNQITGNGGAGVNLGDLSHAWFATDGSINITGNLSGPDVYCAGRFAATRNVASVGGTTDCVEPKPETPKHK